MNEEIKTAIADALKTALSPVSEQITKLQEGVNKVDALAASVEELKKQPTVIHVEANKGVIDKVAPHADALDACAASMEAAGVGMHDRRGHAAVARRMASGMRADAAMGKVPHEFNDANSYWASAEQQQTTKPLQAAAEIKVEDTEAFKKLQNDLAATETKLKDLQAAHAEAKPAPDRKTLTPFVSSLLAKTGIELPEGDKKLAVSHIDAALDKAGITGAQQRIQFKLGLRRQGLIEG